MNESRIEKNSEISKQLNKEERNKKIKSIVKKILWIVIPLFILIIISLFLLKFVGNSGLVVREYAVYNDKLPSDFEGIKIVQFSDIHYNDNYSINKISKVVEMINKTNPDIVIFTGDLIDENYQIDKETLEKIQTEFNSITASIGKYAIKGEEDQAYFTQVFDNSNFTIIDNRIEKIYLGNSSVTLLNADETYSKDMIEGYNENDYVIGVIHKPDLTDRIVNDFNVQMIIAGHSHNGQIILPIFGPLMKKEGAKKYTSSHYIVNNVELFVSGGLGNSKYDFRLFNHPSINFYRLRTNK